uniref:Protein kinase domain-containing protein n=1 Tax=Maylandia zebra TaxID=106582 RepID=A0A3P9DKE6_9CICH
RTQCKASSSCCRQGGDCGVSRLSGSLTPSRFCPLSPPLLHEGGFGIVTKCCNTKTNKVVAIKVNKSDPEILQQAKMEIYILEKLRGLDADRCNIVKWNDFFIDGDRICLNFELLDESLWQYMRYRRNRVLPVTEIRPVLFQLANALSHLGSLGIVHADLKPGNIMVVDRYECPIKVKLIDFGLACPASTVIPGDCVGTVGYKAPEVMIGSLFNEAIDMWSLGLVALATGYPFYPGRNDYDVLKFIIQTQGQPPDHSNDTRSIKLKCLDDLGLLLSIMWGREKIQNVFVSLIKEMLALDPNQPAPIMITLAFLSFLIFTPPPQPVATDGCPFKSLVLSKVSSF